LRCPFGCRQAYSKRGSTQRSVAYYRTQQGRFKKSMHNGNRKRKGNSRAEPPTAPYDEAMIEHVRMATSLFEGRKVSRQEVLAMLEREKKRQQGIGGSEKTEYRAGDLTEDSS
jgi:hypothetical protein